MLRCTTALRVILFLESLRNLVDWVVALVVGASRTQEPCKPSKSTVRSPCRERDQTATVNLMSYFKRFLAWIDRGRLLPLLSALVLPAKCEELSIDHGQY